jgi:exonuclease III
LRSLLQWHDLVALGETHSTPGRVAAFSPPPGTRAFWTHGSTHQAGVGLIASECFLQSFTKVEWDVLEEGRIAKLMLSGAQGSLDIILCYLSASEEAERLDSLRILQNAVRSFKEVETIIIGDFNFVQEVGDRVKTGTLQPLGAANAKVASAFEQDVLRPHRLQEWPQETSPTARPPSSPGLTGPTPTSTRPSSWTASAT